MIKKKPKDKINNFQLGKTKNKPESEQMEILSKYGIIMETNTSVFLISFFHMISSENYFKHFFLLSWWPRLIQISQIKSPKLPNYWAQIISKEIFSLPKFKTRLLKPPYLPKNINLNCYQNSKCSSAPWFMFDLGK